MTENLLFEIGTEELPPSSIIEAKQNLKTLLENNLYSSRIGFVSIETMATPRRIAAFVKNLDEEQKSQEKIITGPPKKIAFDSSGKPTEALKGFARNLKVDVNSLVEVDNGRGIYMALKTIEKGGKTIEVLPDLLKDSILSMSFSKQMTWGDYSVKFARPIRWIAAIFGEEIIKFSIDDLISSDKTYGNRCILSREFKIPMVKNFNEYMDFLEKNAAVILDDAKRKKRIIDLIKEYEEKIWKNKYKVIIDEELLEEVINLIEIPNVLVGSFPEEYLYMPKEILVKAIQHHQRYFAVTDTESNDKISTSFVTIQNGTEDKNGEIIKGNERVLKARLSDAKYFYEEDRKNNFDKWFEKLEGVVFYSGLGSMSQKSLRLKEISQKITGDFKNSSPKLQEKLSDENLKELLSDCERASILCKCDLVTNLVVEFPELQGLVGKEYAKEKGEKDTVSEAIFEHYLPRFADDILPRTVAGSIVSIADKIDTIASMFIAGNIPTGSQDPFALRRKAAGILLICMDKNIDLDIFKLAEFSVKLIVNDFPSLKMDKKKISSACASDSEIKKLAEEITEFIFLRYRFRLEKNQKRTDLFDAIKNTSFSDVVTIDNRYNALSGYIQDSGKALLLTEPLIRCQNIIKNKNFEPVKKEILIEKEEIDLYKILLQKEAAMKNYADSGEYKDYIGMLDELADFAGYVNSFFDNVLVMDEDEKLRNNRINLIKRCTELYYLYADFSKLLIA